MENRWSKGCWYCIYSDNDNERCEKEGKCEYVDIMDYKDCSICVNNNKKEVCKECKNFSNFELVVDLQGRVWFNKGKNGTIEMAVDDGYGNQDTYVLSKNEIRWIKRLFEEIDEGRKEEMK